MWSRSVPSVRVRRFPDVVVVVCVVCFPVVVVAQSWVYATPETTSVFNGESFLGLCDREQLRRRSPFSRTGPGGEGSTPPPPCVSLVCVALLAGGAARVASGAARVVGGSAGLFFFLMDV